MNLNIFDVCTHSSEGHHIIFASCLTFIVCQRFLLVVYDPPLALQRTKVLISKAMIRFSFGLPGIPNRVVPRMQRWFSPYFYPAAGIALPSKKLTIYE